MKSDLETVHGGARTKVERYGWKMLDSPGRFEMVQKGLIHIDHVYQRKIVDAKVIDIASEWSWVAFGVVTLAERPDESLYAIDAQHRVEAAKRRSDISLLPCMIFSVTDVTEEALGFLRANTFRRPLTGVEKYKAKTVVGDEASVRVSKILSDHGYVVSSSGAQSATLKAVHLATRLVTQNADAFERTVFLMSTALGRPFAHERVVSGIWTLISRGAIDPNNPRLIARIKAVGYDGLLQAANKAAAYFARGGMGTWASGMSEALNKGLRNPVSTFKSDRHIDA